MSKSSSSASRPQYDYERNLRHKRIKAEPLKKLILFPKNDVSIETKPAKLITEESSIPEHISPQTAHPYISEVLKTFESSRKIIIRPHRQYLDHEILALANADSDYSNKDLVELSYEIDLVEKAQSSGHSSLAAALGEEEGDDAGAPTIDLDLAKPWNPGDGVPAADKRSKPRISPFDTFGDDARRHYGDPRPRAKNIEYSTGTPLYIHCSAVEFNLGNVEPIFSTLTLIDTKSMKRISESFNFTMTPSNVMKLMGKNLPEIIDPSTTATSCLFNITDKPSTLYCLVRLEHIANHDAGKILDYYKAGTAKGMENLKTKLKKNCERLGSFRAPLGFAYFPVCSEGVFVDEKSKNITDIYRYPKKGFSDEAIMNLINAIENEGAKPPKKKFAGWLKFDIHTLEENDIPEGTLSPALQKLKPCLIEATAPDTVIDHKGELIRQMSEFPTKLTNTRVNRVFENNLFIHPVEFNLSKSPLKAKDISIKIQVLENDSDINAKGLPVIYGRAAEFKYGTHRYTAVQHDTRGNLYDEIKINLPINLEKKHHILFTFMNVAVKHSKGPLMTPIGYSILPLCRKHFISENTFELPIAVADPSFPHTNYLGPWKSQSEAIKWVHGEPRPLFTFSINLKSSIYCQCPPLNTLFKAYDHLSRSASKAASVGHAATDLTDNIIRSIEALGSLKDSKDVAAAVPFIPSVLNILFRIMCNHSTEIGIPAFKSLLKFLDTVCRFDSNIKNNILYPYISTIFDNFSDTQMPVFIGLTRCWQLVAGSKALNDVHDIMTRYSWFLFDIIAKSITLQLGKHNLLLKKRVGRFENPIEGEAGDSYMTLLKKLVTSLADEVSRLSSTGLTQGKELNRWIALFFNDLFSLCDRGRIFDFCDHYVNLLDEAVQKSKDAKAAAKAAASAKKKVNPASSSTTATPDPAVAAPATITPKRSFATSRSTIGAKRSFATARVGAAAIGAPATAVVTPSTAAATTEPATATTGTEPATATPTGTESTAPSSSSSSGISDSTNEITVLEFKFDFIRILVDGEHYIPLNLPVIYPLPQNVEEVEDKILKKHFLVGLLIKHVISTLDLDKPSLISRAIMMLRDLLMKHDFDPRYQGQCKIRVASLYFPLLLYIVRFRSAINKATANDNELRRNWLMCFIWVLRNCDRTLLTEWWRRKPSVLKDFFEVMRSCIHVFRYLGKRQITDIMTGSAQKRMKADDTKSKLEEYFSAMSQSSGRRTTRSFKGGKSMRGTQGRLSMYGGSISAGTFSRSNKKNHSTITSKAQLQFDGKTEGNLSTEINLICLDVVEQFLSNFEEEIRTGVEQGAMLAKVVDVLVVLMETHQSERFLSCLFDSLFAFVERFKTQLFISHTSYLRDICKHLMRLCSFQKLHSVRNRAAAFLYTLFRTNWVSTSGQNIMRTKIQSTLALNQLKVQQEKWLKQALNQVSEYASKDPLNPGSGFIHQVNDLMKRFSSILSQVSLINQHYYDPDMRQEFMYSVAKGYANSPDLRLTWLKKIAEEHLSSITWANQDQSQEFAELTVCNAAEAGITYVHMASLVSEYVSLMRRLAPTSNFQKLKLNTTTSSSSGIIATGYSKSGVPDGCKAFGPITHSALKESALKGINPNDEEGICEGEDFSEAGIISLLHKAINALRRAHMYELVNELFKILVPLLEDQRDYDALAVAHKELSENFNSITSTLNPSSNPNLLHGQRSFGSYFRVAFHSAPKRAVWGDDDGKQFIYHEPTGTHLFAFKSRLEKRYGIKYGDVNIAVLQTSKTIDRSELSEGKYYIQITACYPFFDNDQLVQRVTPYDRNYKINKFFFETPFSKGSKKVSENVADIWIRKVILTTENSFPFLKKRSLVVTQPVEIVTTPIENAVNQMSKKNKQLEGEKVSRNLKTLQGSLSGSILPTVNAGPRSFIMSFLSRPFKDFVEGTPEYTQHAKHVLELKNTFREFMRLLDDLLQMHDEMLEQTVGEHPEHASLQHALAAEYRLLVNRFITPFLSDEAVSDELLNQIENQGTRATTNSSTLDDL